MQWPSGSDLLVGDTEPVSVKEREAASDGDLVGVTPGLRVPVWVQLSLSVGWVVGVFVGMQEGGEGAYEQLCV